MSIPNVIINLARDHQHSIIELAVMFIARREKKPESRQIKAIAEAVGRVKPVISRAVSSLAKDGMVTTECLKGDRRTCVVTLTEAGRDALKVVEGAR